MKLILSIMLALVASCSSNKINYEYYQCGGPGDRDIDYKHGTPLSTGGFDELQAFCECASNPINQGSIDTITINCASEVIGWEARTDDEEMLPISMRVGAGVTTLIGDINLGTLWTGTAENPTPIGCQTAHEVIRTKLKAIPMTCNEFLQFPDQSALAAFCGVALVPETPTIADTGDTRTTCGSPLPPDDGKVPCSGGSGKVQWCHWHNDHMDEKCESEAKITKDHVENGHPDRYMSWDEWGVGECQDFPGEATPTSGF